MESICCGNKHLLNSVLAFSASPTSLIRGYTPLYELYKYVRPQRVWIFLPFWSEIANQFGPFWCQIGPEFCSLVLNCLCLFRKSYFFIIIDKTINESPSQFF